MLPSSLPSPRKDSPATLSLLIEIFLPCRTPFTVPGGVRQHTPHCFWNLGLTPLRGETHTWRIDDSSSTLLLCCSADAAVLRTCVGARCHRRRHRCLLLPGGLVAALFCLGWMWVTRERDTHKRAHANASAHALSGIKHIYLGQKPQSLPAPRLCAICAHTHTHAPSPPFCRLCLV